MNRFRLSPSLLLLAVALLTLLFAPAAFAQAPGAAYHVPSETTNQESGYFSIIEGHDGKLYIGTAKYGENAYLVAFDPDAGSMKIVVDAHKELGYTVKGFAAQSKFHTRNNVGKSGKIYIGTKQGYIEKDKEPHASLLTYPGGYPMVYDPKTGTTKVYPIPVPHEGISSIMPDESRGIAYISTCSDTQGNESAHFMVLDLKTGKYRDLVDTHHVYAFIVVDRLGRAYHPVVGGGIARFTPAGNTDDPTDGTLEIMKQTIDGKPPTEDSLLATKNGHPINWDFTPDRTAIYCVAMSGNQLYRYDLTTQGDTIKGKSLGPLLKGIKGSTDCRSMAVGADGRCWMAVTATFPGVGRRAHLVSYAQGDAAPIDHGPIEVTNPGDTDFKGANGKLRPWHHGMPIGKNGIMRPLYPLGLAVGKDGFVYPITLYPFSVIRIDGNKLVQRDAR